MTSEVDQTKGQGQLFLDVQYPLPFPPKIFFGVGSVGINQDLLLTDQIFLHGGISYFHLNDLLLPSAASTKEIFVSIMSFDILAMPQVFEQSLFLFLSGKERKVKH